MYLILNCPIDLLPLEKKENSFICAHNHCFDCAKQGYVNLLPVQQKHSLHPGDNREMVLARAQFLNLGLYQDIADCVLSETVDFFENSSIQTFHYADSACGEGYYTSAVDAALRLKFQDVYTLGFDISKEAVKAAAKRSKNVLWAVAGNHRIPLPAQSVHLLSSLFGFPVYSEFNRVLAANGLLALVMAGQNHLIELRQKIYQNVRLKEPDLLLENKGFRLIKQVRLTQKMRLKKTADFENLFKMTPHYYRITPQKHQEIMQNPPLELTKDVVCAFYTPVK